ncbi:MAG: hypothetical protein FI718_00130 [SAR202 cluster bacterium]|nr:hypothetical protein [SAR202 cluster bacterium]
MSDNLIYQVIRVPAQGEWLNVRDKAIEGFKFMDTPGLVSVTLSHPFGTNLTISSQYVFPIDFINQFDGTATTEIEKKQIEMEKLCKNTREVIKAIVEPVELAPKDTKFVVNHFLKTLPGKKNQVIDLVRDWRGKLDGTKPLIAVPVSSDQNEMVEVSYPISDFNRVIEGVSGVKSDKLDTRPIEMLNQMLLGNRLSGLVDNIYRIVQMKLIGSGLADK